MKKQQLTTQLTLYFQGFSPELDRTGKGMLRTVEKATWLVKTGNAALFK